MKLVAWMSGGCAAVAVAGLLASLACGCSCSTARVASPQAGQAGQAGQAALSEATGTTQLMSAQLPAPPPKVGKSHLADVPSDEAADATDVSDALGAPKEARRSDASGRAARGGHFGTTSK